MLRILITTKGKVVNDAEEEGAFHIGTQPPIVISFIDDVMSAFATLTLHPEELERQTLETLPNYLVSKTAQLSLAIEDLVRQLGDRQETSGD